MLKIPRADILVLTPYRKSFYTSTLSCLIPPLTQGVDSVPLRLAAVIEKKYSVAFFPASQLFGNCVNDDFAMKEFNEFFKYLKAKVLIISTDYHISNRSTAYLYSSLLFAQEAKKFNPYVKIIGCGKHAIVSTVDYFNTNNVFDVVIRTEAEDIILLVLDKLLNNGVLDNIPNISYLKNGEIIFTETNFELPDISKLPPPAFALLKPYKTIMLKKERPFSYKVPITLRTSYGCPYECPFCAGLKTWNKYRVRGINGIEADIAAFKKIASFSEISFIDDEMFSFDKTHVRNVATVFQQNKIFIKGLLTHTAFFNDDIAFEISKFSNSILFGAESFINFSLDKIQKKQKYKDIVHALDVAKKYELKTRLECIVGLPDDTVNIMYKNIRRAMNLILMKKVDSISTYILCPHPGTEYEKNASQYGIKIAHRRYEEYHESGGFPAYSTNKLNRQEIYGYYLLMTNAIRIAYSIRDLFFLR